GDKEVWSGGETLGEPRRNHLPHSAHRLWLFSDGPLNRREGDALGAVLGVKCEDVDVLLGRKSLGRRSDAELVVALGFEIILYVSFDNPAVRASPDDRRGIDGRLPGELGGARADSEHFRGRYRAWRGM